MLEKIVGLADAIASPSPEERDFLRSLSSAAEQALAGRLPSDIRPEDCGEAFPCAAALMAASTLLSCRGGGEIRSFAAGDVHISTGGKCSPPDRLWAQAEALIAPFTGDPRFAFRGVEG